MSSSVQISVPILDGKNYLRWNAQMKVLFDYHELLSIVESGVPELEANASKEKKTIHRENKKKDMEALFLIHQDVNDEVFEKIAAATTSKEAWDILLTTYHGAEKTTASMNHDNFVIETTALLEKAEPMTADCCIHRVPYDIRRLREDAFTPKIVSIGPFYHGHPRLQNMENYKLLYFKQFYEKAGVSMDTLISFAEEVEPGVRRCYSETIELSREQLVKVILVDSVFLFELFWRSFYDEWSEDDAIHLKPWLTSTMRVDLMLLENQLPFFVLERLFNLAFASNIRIGNVHSFLELTFDYFAHYNNLKLDHNDVGNSIWHFTDLIRTFHIQPEPVDKRPQRPNESVIYLPNATELTEAGVRFRKSTSPCLLDLKFRGRVLEIPEFKVEDWTETLFRNLVALEQCLYPYDSCFTDYVAVLDFLINTSKDVDILVQNGIILNWLGESNSVADLFNSLWKNVTHVNFSSQYFALCKDLNAFCKSPWHKMRASLRRDYCNTPWQTTASIAGILLLALTLTQTVCSILQVLQQNGQIKF